MSAVVVRWSRLTAPCGPLSPVTVGRTQIGSVAEPGKAKVRGTWLLSCRHRLSMAASARVRSRPAAGIALQNRRAKPWPSTARLAPAPNGRQRPGRACAGTSPALRDWLFVTVDPWGGLVRLGRSERDHGPPRQDKARSAVVEHAGVESTLVAARPRPSWLSAGAGDDGEATLGGGARGNPRPRLSTTKRCASRLRGRPAPVVRLAGRGSTAVPGVRTLPVGHRLRPRIERGRACRYDNHGELAALREGAGLAGMGRNGCGCSAPCHPGTVGPGKARVIAGEAGRTARWLKG
jgi:hypothetical protein